MDYLLKASGIVFVLFLFYQLFLKNETFFKSIRVFFIVGLLIVLTIPLIEIPIYIETVANQINTLDYEEIISATITEQNIDWTQIITLTYLIGIVFFSLKFLVQLVSLGRLFSKHKLIKQENYYFVETTKIISPFSFFNIILYNKSQFSIEELKHIINHEKAHVQQWHSIDTILAHLMVITLWFNPFVWLYKKAVQQNLEFLADSYALELANNNKQYQLTLLKTYSTSYCTEITNNFYNSLLKKRIIMLHKNQSTNKSQWKYALLIPLLTAFIFAFNTKTIAQEKKFIKVKEVNESKTEIIINKDSKTKTLNKIKSTFKKINNIDLSFKGIKRNSNNEIIAIKIDAKGKDLRAKFENAGTKPIKPIKIAYNSENNSVSISNLNKVHKSHYTYTIHEDSDHNEKITIEGKQDKGENFIFITSDDKTKTWAPKGNKSKNIEFTVISKNDDDDDDDEYVWINENGENNNVKVKVTELNKGKRQVEVIHEINDTHQNLKKNNKHEVIIIKNDDSTSKKENIFIVKTDGDDIKKHKITKKFRSSKNEKPLIIIDGKETSSEEMENIKPDSIEKVEVLKGESATKKYGDKGKNGVIIITSKKE